jgi:hypothetical protein
MFGALPDADHVHAFPVPVSTSRNSRGQVYSYVVELLGNGTIRSDWGGWTRQKTPTLYDQPTEVTQGMDIDVTADGAVLGAAEIDHAGDFDSFVVRFGASSGAVDSRFATHGLEPIDTVVGALDGEYVMGMATDEQGRAWVIGGREVRGRGSMHMFHTYGSSIFNRSTPMTIGAIDSHGRGLRCGRTKRSACVVPRGGKVHVGTSVAGWPASSLGLLQPAFHIWSKSPRGQWTPSERVGKAFRAGGRTASELNVRLPAGEHEITVTRNGAAGWGSSWYGTLYVRVQ